MQLHKSERVLTFLSYAREDLVKASKVYEGLKKRKVKIWFDKNDMKSGKWMPQIKQAIAISKYFIICLSEAAIKKMGEDKGFQKDEFSFAYEFAMNQPENVFCIIPVRLEDCGRGDRRFTIYQQYDLYHDFENSLDRLAVNLGGVSLSDAKTKDERTEDERNKNLKNFETAELLKRQKEEMKKLVTEEQAPDKLADLERIQADLGKDEALTREMTEFGRKREVTGGIAKQELANLEKEYMDFGDFAEEGKERVSYNEIDELKDFAKNEFKLEGKITKRIIDIYNAESFRKNRQRHRDLKRPIECIETNSTLASIKEFPKKQPLATKKNYYLYKLWKNIQEKQRQDYKFIYYQSDAWPEPKVYTVKEGDPLLSLITTPPIQPTISENKEVDLTDVKINGVKITKGVIENLSDFAARFPKIEALLTASDLARYSGGADAAKNDMQEIPNARTDKPPKLPERKITQAWENRIKMWLDIKNEADVGKRFFIYREDATKPIKLYTTTNIQLIELGDKCLGAGSPGRYDNSPAIDLGPLSRIHPSRITEYYLRDITFRAEQFRKKTIEITDEILNKSAWRKKNRLTIQEIGDLFATLPSALPHLGSPPTIAEVNDILTWEKVLEAQRISENNRKVHELFIYNGSVYTRKPPPKSQPKAAKISNIIYRASKAVVFRNK